MKKDYFVTIQNCFTSSGYTRSLIIDTQRTQFFVVPHEVCEIINYKFGNDIEVIKNTFDNSDIIQEYFDFLIDNEIIIRTPKNLIKNFPKIEKKILIPSISEILIVELSIDNLNFISQLANKLHTKHLEVRIDLNNIKLALSLLEDIKDTSIHSIQFIISNQYLLSISSLLNEIIEKINLNERVINTIIEGSLDSKNQKPLKFQLETDEVALHRNIVVNIKLFMESNFFNPFYHNKMFVSINNEVFNTPKKNIKFGTVNDILLMNKKDLISLYCHYLNKPNSQVLVCKNCEFRFSCINSLHRELNINNELFNKTECNYNPYICKWQGEEGYLTLEECGVISNEHGFSIDHEKIAKINKQLWGE